MTPYTSYDPRELSNARDPRHDQVEQEKQEQRVNAVMREMEQHGEHLANWANRLATMLLAVFSTASLLSLSLAAFNTFMAQLAAGHLDIPDALSVLLNLLLVLAMDMAMFYAASVIRAVASAGGATREIAVHVVVMATASLLETATYIYLVVQYDRPTNAWLWAIGIGRGIAAPLFATYLSLARKLPVAPRDIAYYVALLSGRGVVHDVAVLAADRHAPLHRKVNIYTAAATMAAAEHAKFSRIIAAVEDKPAAVEAKRQEEPKPQQTPAPEQPGPEREPGREPGRQREQRPVPIPMPVPSRQPPTPQREPQREMEREPQRELAPAARTVAPPAIVEVTGAQRRPQARRGARRGLGSAGFRSVQLVPEGRDVGADVPETPDRLALRLRREAAARRILAENPTINSRDLARQIAVATKTRTSESTARNIRDALRFVEVDEDAPHAARGDEEGDDTSAIEERRN